MLVSLTARQTTDLAASALASGRGAGLPELLELVQTLASKMEEISLTEISDLIEQDPVVSARLVNMANLIALNPGMTTLTSVKHAIHQIGFHRVRSLAISLMLLKSTGTKQNPPEQRQAAARALCSGLLAQACARQVSAVDPEMVFACTTLRQLGRILLPVVSLEHYKAAEAIARTEPEDQAFRDYFGITPLELSRALLKGYALPKEVRQALEDGTENSASAHGVRLVGLAEYGSQLTHIVMDVDTDEATYLRTTAELATRFESVVPDLGEMLESTLTFAAERLSQFMQTPGASAFPEMMLRRIRTRLPKPAVETEAKVSRPLETAPQASAVPARPSIPLVSATPFPVPAPKAKPAPPSPPLEPPSVFTEHVTLVPEPVPTASAAEPWLDVLRPVRDGFGATDCVVFLRTARDGPFVLTEGLGPFAAHHLDLASVHPAERTVFSIALARRETVVIHDSRTPTLKPHLPTWFQNDSHTPGAFFLTPLVVRNHIAGLMLVGWAQPRRIELTPEHEAMLHLLRTSSESLCQQAVWPENARAS